MKNYLRVALHGSYYGNNFGDTLLLDLFARWIRESGASRVILPHASPEHRISIGAEGVGLSELMRVKALIYAGGGYFGEPPGAVTRWAIRNAGRHLPCGLITRLRRKSYAILGVGAGPVSNHLFRRAIRYLFDGARVIAVRDVQSKQFLVDLGVRVEHLCVTADAALTVTPEDIPKELVESARDFLKENPHPLKIGIHLDGVPSMYATALDMVMDELASILSDNRDLSFIVFSDNDYGRRVPLEDVVPPKSVARVTRVPYRGHWSLVALISQLNLVITTKLHVGIVANALGIPTLSIPFHEKTPRFYQQIGYSERCHPLRSLRSGELTTQLLRLIEDGATSIVPEDVRVAAFKNRELVHKFVSSVLD